MKFENQVIEYGLKENLTEEEVKSSQGKLFIISTPIGNFDDISIRGLNLLKMSDMVICEELKEGAHLLKTYKLNKELIALNEQTESKEVGNVINLLKSGKKLALISDAGTPLFADPGLKLLQAALRANINIEVAPGASSVMTALVRSGFNIDKFFFAGFLSRKSDERLIEMQQLKNFPFTIVLLETPYRLLPFLEAASEVMPNRNVYIGMNLTMIYETHHYGTFRELYHKFSKDKVKSEFVVVIEGTSESILDLKQNDKSFLEKKEGSTENSGSGFRSDYRSERRTEYNSDSRERGGERRDNRRDDNRRDHSGVRDSRNGDRRDKRDNEIGQFGREKFSKGNSRSGFRDGDRKFSDKKFGDKKFGDKKFGDKKFGDKKFGDKKFDDRKFDDRKSNFRKDDFKRNDSKSYDSKPKADKKSSSDGLSKPKRKVFKKKDNDD